MQCGANEVEIAADPSISADTADGVSSSTAARSRGGLESRPRLRSHASKRSPTDALFIADRGEVSGDYLYYRYPWGADPDGKAVVEAEAKVKSGSSFIIVANGESGERLGLWPDRIELFHHRKLQYKMDTTDDFHLYRMELKGHDLKVYVDGELPIDAPGALMPRSGYIGTKSLSARPTAA